jgi:tetratricopeptide (TPR) repeat protein
MPEARGASGLLHRRLLLPLLLLAALAGEGQISAQQPTTAAADVERRLVAAAREHTDSLAAQHDLAEFYISRGRLADAIPWLERARTINPAHEATGYNLTLAYLETGRIDAARQEVARLLALKQSGELLNLKGDIEARAGDFRAAAEPYQRAAYLQPTEDYLFDWGDNLLNLRAYDDAADVFVAAIKRYPSSSRLQIGLGIAHYSKGRYEEAAASFGRAADLSPDDPRPYQFLGEMYGVTPDVSGEITARFARLVERRPEFALGHYYYAMLLWKGQPAAAAAPDLTRIEALLRRAATLEPRNAKPVLQLGILLLETRRWPDAVIALESAVQLAPDLAQAHFRLSQAYRRTGQTARANEELAIFEKLEAKRK